MTSQRGERKPRGTAVVEVKNIGGIDHTIVEFGPGPTVLRGRNATNRSSFLRSIMAALGSDLPSLKADADEGHVQMTIGGERYTRTLKRTPNGIVRSGDPYLDDAEDADLFAFLLGDNEVRLSIERDEDLRELLLQPVDTEQIESDITRLMAERDETDRQLAEIDRLRDAFEEMEVERTQVAARMSEIRDRVESTEDPAERIPLETGSRQDLENALVKLRKKRGQLEDIRYEIRTERESIQALETDLESIEESIDELPTRPDLRREELDEEIDRLQSREARLETRIGQLGAVREFNHQMLDQLETPFEEAGPDLQAFLDDGDFRCWTCGTAVNDEAIRETLEVLDSLREGLVDDRSEIVGDLRSARTERTSLQRQASNRENLENERASILEDIERRHERISDLRERAETLGTEIETLEGVIAEMEYDDYDDLLDEQRELNALEFELQRLEEEWERLSMELADMREAIERRGALESQRAEITEDIVELRTRVDRIETEAIAAFNEHMKELLEVLDYHNIERVWIERRSGESNSEFVSHVVRRDEDGATYEDSVAHLSESEREVIGLVFALAGYLVHELHEEVPFILLDSLEVIDSDRIATIVKYFSEYAEWLVVALLPEDASAIGDDVEYVTNLGESSNRVTESSA